MKPRDRLVVSVLVAAAALAAVWIGVVSPKRNDASQVGAKLTVAQSQLGTAQAQLASAKAAESSYPANLRVVKSLYKAVPSNAAVPHLLVSLDKSSHYKRVDFKVITVDLVGGRIDRRLPGRDASGRPLAGGLHVHASTAATSRCSTSSARSPATRC